MSDGWSLLKYKININMHAVVRYITPANVLYVGTNGDITPSMNDRIAAIRGNLRFIAIVLD